MLEREVFQVHALLSKENERDGADAQTDVQIGLARQVGTGEGDLAEAVEREISHQDGGDGEDGEVLD